MKIKQLTTLKHKLQWLLLLAALLGVSQGVWATYPRNTNVYLDVDGFSSWVSGVSVRMHLYSDNNCSDGNYIATVTLSNSNQPTNIYVGNIGDRSNVKSIKFCRTNGTDDWNPIKSGGELDGSANCLRVTGWNGGHMCYASQFSGTDKMYFNITSTWTASGAHIFAYFYGSGNSWSSEMTTPISGTTYEVSVPSGFWNHVIVVRKNSSDSNPNWDNVWNQTCNLSLVKNKNYLSSASYSVCGDNAWGTYDPCSAPAKPSISDVSICYNTAPTFSFTSSSTAKYQLYTSSGDCVSDDFVTGDGGTKSLTANTNITENTSYFVRATTTVDGCSNTTDSDPATASVASAAGYITKTSGDPAFGSVDVGNTKDVNFTYSIGCGANTFSVARTSGSTDFTYNNDASVSDSQLTFSITFSPTGSGAKSATFTISFANSGSQELEVTGTAVAEATKWAVKGGFNSWTGGDFDANGDYSVSIATAGVYDFKLNKSENSTWRGKSTDVVIPNVSMTLTEDGGEGNDCKLYAKVGTYNFHFEGRDGSGNPIIKVTYSGITASAPSNIYIKGPIHDDGCWPSTYTALTKNGNVYTHAFTAYKKNDCTYGKSEFILTTAQNENEVLNRYFRFDNDGGWRYTTRAGITDQSRPNFEGSLDYSAGDRLVLTVTWDNTNKKYTMSLVKCATPTITSVSAAESETEFCAGTTGVVFTAVVGDGSGAISSYSWTAPDGWNKTDQSDNTATYTIGSNSGNVSVTATNSCGSTSASTSCTITVDAASVAGSVSAESNPICSGTSTTLSIPSGNTGSITQWKYYDTTASDWVNLSTDATPSTGNISASTQYKAIVKNGVCAEVESSPYTVNMKSTPDAPVFSGTPATKLCENTTGNSYSITGTADAFIWEKGSDLSWTSDPTTSSKTVSVNVASSITDGASSYIKVKAQNCGSLESSYATTNINLYKSASAGVVTLSSSTTCVGDNTITASQTGTVLAGGGSVTGWSSSNTDVATISSTTGAPITLTAVSTGVSNITYTISDVVCGSSTTSTSATFAVNANPVISLNGGATQGETTPWAYHTVTATVTPSATASWEYEFVSPGSASEPSGTVERIDGNTYKLKSAITQHPEDDYYLIKANYSSGACVADEKEYKIYIVPTPAEDCY